MITPEEESKGKWSAEKTLLFQAPFFKEIPQATVDAYRMDWKTRFFVFLATPWVASLLFMGLIIGAYLEFSQPGLSLPGAVALSCLFLIALSSFALEIADWLELILLVSGLILLSIELFVLPTFGLLGIAGAILFIIGLFGLLLPSLNSVSFDYDTQTFNSAGQYVLERLLWLCGAIVASGFIIALLSRFLGSHFSAYNRLVLHGNEQDASRGYISGDDPAQLPQPGSKGEALTTLRPSGKIIVDEKIYEAVSPGSFIEAREPIVVVRLEGSVIVVKRIGESR